jgi:hypothetical protein
MRMRIARRSVWCWLIAGIISLWGAEAQAQKPHLLFGAVTNVNGVPIKGVVITIANSRGLAVTNDSGVYIIESPPTGRVRLTAKRIGFRPKELGFRIDPGVNKEVGVEMEGNATELDSVLVMAEQSGASRMADFWNRRMLGIGAFITRAEIERRRPYLPTDLLKMVVGVSVLSDGGVNRPLITMGRSSGGFVNAPRGTPNHPVDCRVNYYVDGMWMSPGTFHPDDIPAMAIEAMEIYRGASEIPIRFRQFGTSCGLIVIWTREPPAKAKADTTAAPSPNR